MKTKKRRHRSIFVMIAVCFVSAAIITSTLLNISSSRHQQEILEDSITSQITSVCITATEIVSEYPFETYNSMADAEAEGSGYFELRDRLRDLAHDTGVTYLYILKYIGGECQFVIDTDEEDEEVFIPYEPAEVHLEAFAGKSTAGVMNVVDEYGTFNGGAAPLFKDGEVIGAICVDIEDSYIQKSRESGTRNEFLSLAAMFFVLVCLISFTAAFYLRIRREQSKLENMALYDSVTSLPNRQHFYEYTEEYMKQHPGEPFALFFLDLDNFKQINDPIGHDEGDVVLYSFGQFIKHHNEKRARRISFGEAHICARIGGDEFLYMIGDISSPEEAGRIAASLLDEFNTSEFEPYISKYQFGVSIGISFYPHDSADPEELIALADQAMYQSKHSGKGTYNIYDPNIEKQQSQI